MDLNMCVYRCMNQINLPLVVSSKCAPATGKLVRKTSFSRVPMPNMRGKFSHGDPSTYWSRSPAIPKQPRHCSWYPLPRYCLLSGHRGTCDMSGELYITPGTCYRREDELEGQLSVNQLSREIWRGHLGRKGRNEEEKEQSAERLVSRVDISRMILPS